MAFADGMLASLSAIPNHAVEDLHASQAPHATQVRNSLEEP